MIVARLTLGRALCRPYFWWIMEKVKIKLRTGLATDRGAFNPGDVVMWDAKDAMRKDGLIDKGFAELVDDPTEPEPKAAK